MKQFIVYAGANGAGKSSLRAGGTDPVDVEIDPDRIARQINPSASRSVDFEAGKEALRLFDRTLAEERSMSIETTLTGRSILGRMQAAKDAGYDVTLRYVALNDPEENIRRVEGRVAQGGHWIAPETIRRRTTNSLENLPAAAAIADRSVLFDNSGTAHREVLAIERGRVIYQAPDPPAWLTGQIPRITSELERVAREGRADPSFSPALSNQPEAVNRLVANAAAAQQEAAPSRTDHRKALREATAELSQDGRLLLAAASEKIDREMNKVNDDGKTELKAYFATELVKKEKAEGPVVLSPELKRAATAPEPAPQQKVSEPKRQPEGRIEPEVPRPPRRR